LRRKPWCKSHAVRIAQYVLGFFVTAAGVVFIIRSGLGAGPWDTVTYNLHALANITLGNASFIVNATVLAVVILGRKKLRFIFALVPIFGISLMLDLWDIVLLGGRLMDNPLVLNAALYGGGIFVLTTGLSLIILSGYPAMVFDELMLLIMDLVKTKSVLLVRLGVELFAIALGSVLGYAASIGFGAVNWGSFFIAIFIAPALAWQLKTMKGMFYVKADEM